MCKTLKKQHYELIAEALNFETLTTGGYNVRENAIRRLEKALAENNREFNADKFRKACGL